MTGSWRRASASKPLKWSRLRNGAAWHTLRGTEIVSVPLEEAVGTLKYLDPNIYNLAQLFYG
ncbi:MAG: hypothetical protein WKF84_06325 [Pyrinomonadaceae bacterium]